MDPGQTAPRIDSSVRLVSYLQQTTSADDIFRCIFLSGALRVKQIERTFERQKIGHLSGKKLDI